MSHAFIMCRWIICFAFLIAVIGKLRGRKSFREFAESLDGWTGLRLSESARTSLALAVIVGEIFIVALTVFDRSAFFGMLLAIGVLLFFTLATAISVRAGRRILCNCFGRGVRDVSTVHFVRNGILLVTSGVGAAGGSLVTSSVLPLVLALVIAIAISRIEDIGYLFG
ncbi:MauE/DoxX family redox-associated membrane protein [Streptosporangium sp. G11]|uniref:MauE/DoxX family redox-associated membrane protein n=1 Tax=Streptosporangium sp. G11 TaxID=3436926 RepID=UPI003EB97F22